jgi:hypothetical protein
VFNQIKWLFINQLWDDYRADLWQVARIQTAFEQELQEVLVWDHFAIIDLPGPYSGINALCELFFTLDYEFRGQDYLAEKQNEFVWLAEKFSETRPARLALPQIVVADFRRAALVPEVRRIVDKYAAYAKPFDITQLKHLKQQILRRDKHAGHQFLQLMAHGLKGRDWPLPTIKEFEIVKKANELLAWVLVKGRQVNHFALAVHLCEKFKNLKLFNQFISKRLKISLQNKGGIIKGNRAKKIEQSATEAMTKSIPLADGFGNLAERFIEFVWRYPQSFPNSSPKMWNDYFTGFVAENADHVIESLYLAAPCELK